MPTAEDARAELYGVDLERFVKVRGELAKRLRAQGDREAAAEVAKLRKPPATAWALNQVARARPALVTELLESGAELRVATDAALRGDASAVRPAEGRHRQAADAVIDAAAARLVGAGHAGGDQARQRMAATVRAAVVDEEVARRLAGGVLDEDREAPGFGLDPGAVPAEAPRRKDERAGKGKAAEANRAEQAERVRAVERLERRAERLRRLADDAAARAEAARLEADAAAREAEAARREVGAPEGS